MTSPDTAALALHGGTSSCRTSNSRERERTEHYEKELAHRERPLSSRGREAPEGPHWISGLRHEWGPSAASRPQDDSDELTSTAVHQRFVV
jgi:hypothetical protein